MVTTPDRDKRHPRTTPPTTAPAGHAIAAIPTSSTGRRVLDAWRSRVSPQAPGKHIAIPRRNQAPDLGSSPEGWWRCTHREMTPSTMTSPSGVASRHRPGRELLADVWVADITVCWPDRMAQEDPGVTESSPERALCTRSTQSGPARRNKTPRSAGIKDLHQPRPPGRWLG